MSRPDQVLSASRRTDIPAFYLDWFMQGIRQQSFSVDHPFTGKPRRIRVAPETFHSIVLWSKNYAPFIRSGAADSLKSMGYHLFFNFTVNTENRLLEPHVPSLDQRLKQMEALVRTEGPDAVAWRFDPVCFYTLDPDQSIRNTLGDFRRIADRASDLGMTTCITSFLDPYTKIRRRLDRIRKTGQPAPDFIDPPVKQKIKVTKAMARLLEQRDITLALCCEKTVFDRLPFTHNLVQSACVDGMRLNRLFGGSPDARKDTGQRRALGCRCTRSVDIGSYRHHPCRHDCLFCYASPAMDQKRKQNRSRKG